MDAQAWALVHVALPSKGSSRRKSSLPEARTSRSLSGLGPLARSADRRSSRAEAGVVEAGRRKIQGTLLAVSDRSSASARTGTKALSASCSRKVGTVSIEGEYGDRVLIHKVVNERG